MPPSKSNVHCCRCAPHWMALPSSGRLLDPPPAPPAPQPRRRVFVWSRLTAGFLKSCILSPALLGTFPVPSGLPRWPRARKKRYGRRPQFLIPFCSNLQETARRENVPLIMTPLCFLKASFWTFKSSQVSSSLSLSFPCSVFLYLN